MAPKISVCMPTYNYGNYISSAVESVLDQELTDFELIIVDDCSEDNTEDVVTRFLHDKRVSFEKNEWNLGLVANWNKCLSKARGEYIKFVFADDMLVSRVALSRMASILDSDPSVTLVASARNLMDSESRITGLISHFPRDFIADGPDTINRCLKEDHNLIGEPTVVMFRKADGARGFDARFQQDVDLEMWFHLLEKGRFAFIAEPLASFRVHPEQKTKENAARFIHLDDRYLLFKEYLGRSYLNIGFIRRFYERFNILYLLRKFGKNGVIAKEEAKRRIRVHCPFLRFWCQYVLFKLFRLLFKVGGKINQKRYEHGNG